jgi:hypothetical protein
MSRTPFEAEAGDLWLRARTNAIAHKLSAATFARRNIIFSLLSAIATVIPILVVAVSLQHLRGGSSEIVPLPFGWQYATFAYIAITSNGIALLLGLVGKDLRYSERVSQHRTQLSGYSIIAQKARRLDTADIPPEEARHLLRHLQETFEIYKSSPFEPSDKTFTEAQRIVRKLKPLPFNLESGRND